MLRSLDVRILMSTRVPFNSLRTDWFNRRYNVIIRRLQILGIWQYESDDCPRTKKYSITQRIILGSDSGFTTESSWPKSWPHQDGWSGDSDGLWVRFIVALFHFHRYLELFLSHCYISIAQYFFIKKIINLGITDENWVSSWWLSIGFSILMCDKWPR